MSVVAFLPAGQVARGSVNDNSDRSGIYYPEMGGTPNLTRLFRARTDARGAYLKWPAKRHAEALEAFKRLRIRPQHMAQRKPTDFLRPQFGDEDVMTCGVTWVAFRKLADAKLTTTECLLD